MKAYNKRMVNNFLLKENLLWNNPVVAWAMLSPVSIPGFLYNSYQIRKNLQMTSGFEKAKVLVFDDPLTEWQSLMLGVKGSVAKFFTERDVRIDYKHNARSNDLKNVLRDESYQNIVVMGHGGRNCWCARDGEIYTEDVNKWMKGLPKKNGYFIQFTCGDVEGIPLGNSVVKDKSKILGYTKPVNLGDRFDSLWGESQKGIEGLTKINDTMFA